MHKLLLFVVWAACYQWSGCFPDFATSFYYSATSYSTVGYGDVIPPGNWRILGAVEAVTGILMFGWRPKTTFELVHVYRPPSTLLIARFAKAPDGCRRKAKANHVC